MSAQPWMKFYPQDWRADEKLRMCSLAARGLWLEMLAIMHRSERYGLLLIAGRVPTDAQLAVQVGAPPDQVTSLLGELETAGVYSRAASGAIYSRRMTRDQKKAETARKNGKRGGNPSLRKQKGNPASDNPSLKPKDKGGVKAQIPEARYQTPSESRARADDPVLKRVYLAAGMLRPPRDAGLLNDWIRAGCDLELDVLPVVEKTTERMRARGDPPASFRLFDGDVRASAGKRHDDAEQERRRLNEIAERYPMRGAA